MNKDELYAFGRARGIWRDDELPSASPTIKSYNPVKDEVSVEDSQKPIVSDTSVGKEDNSLGSIPPSFSQPAVIESDVIQVTGTEKIGIEVEMPNAILVGKLRGDDVLAQSEKGYRVGDKLIPDIELQVEQTHITKAVGKKNSFIEIVFGPLSRKDILSKDFTKSISTLQELCAKKNLLKNIIKDYNKSLDRNSKFKMTLNKKFDDVLVSPLSSVSHLAMQTNIMLDFCVIGSNEKVSNLFNGCTQKSEKNQFIRAQKIAKEWHEKYGYSRSQRVRSFLTFVIYHTDFYNRNGIKNVKEDSKEISLPVFFRTSAEDIIYSILNEKDVQELIDIGISINNKDKGTSIAKTVFLQMNSKNGECRIDENFKKLFLEVLPHRLSIGHPLRLTEVNDDYDFTGVGLDKVINLTMPWPDCRRDVMQKGNKHYIVVEIRDHKSHASLNWEVGMGWAQILGRGGAIGDVL